MDYEYYIYDQIMMKNRVCFDKCFLPEQEQSAKEKLAVKIIGYALEYYLGWEPACGTALHKPSWQRRESLIKKNPFPQPFDTALFRKASRHEPKQGGFGT